MTIGKTNYQQIGKAAPIKIAFIELIRSSPLAITSRIYSMKSNKPAFFAGHAPVLMLFYLSIG